MTRARSGTDEQIRTALSVCSEWVTDSTGDIRKDCTSCPYRDENDPAGMNCGERLMADAGRLIDEMKEKIEHNRQRAHELVKEIDTICQGE